MVKENSKIELTQDEAKLLLTAVTMLVSPDVCVDVTKNDLKELMKVAEKIRRIFKRKPKLNKVFYNSKDDHHEDEYYLQEILKLVSLNER